MERYIKNVVDEEFKTFVYFEEEDCDISLFLFTKSNIFRRGLYRMVKASVYTAFFNICMLISLMIIGISTFFDYEDIHSH
jgi:hypothetical protein